MTENYTEQQPPDISSDVFVYILSQGEKLLPGIEEFEEYKIVSKEDYLQSLHEFLDTSFGRQFFIWMAAGIKLKETSPDDIQKWCRFAFFTANYMCDPNLETIENVYFPLGRRAIEECPKQIKVGKRNTSSNLEDKFLKISSSLSNNDREILEMNLKKYDLDKYFLNIRGVL